MSKLPYIPDDVLFREVKKVLDIARTAVDEAEIKLHNNVIDPFSAVFDSLRQMMTLSDWLEQEKARQIQKTMQNALGDFHQAIIGNITGWEDLGVGHVADVKSDRQKIVAEVKNKYNTTKGNHKKVIYDDLLNLITSSYDGYTGYYVEIIPKSKRPYDKPFTPSDNETKQRRPLNQKIRVIDGRSFYKIATGSPDALKQLYQVLPIIVSEIMGTDPERIVQDPLYVELFKRAYPPEV